MSSAPLAFLELTTVSGHQTLVAVAEISSISAEPDKVHHFDAGEKRAAGALVTMRNGERFHMRDDVTSIRDRIRAALGA